MKTRKTSECRAATHLGAYVHCEFCEMEEMIVLVVGSNRNRVLVVANVTTSAQLALLGFGDKRLCLGKQFHDSIAAFWTLTIRCNHLTSPIVRRI
jgi:hypothetical protein